ncbi:FlgO family outer membrane protein [Desulfocurvus sp. DL9XJH121]
MKAHATLEHPLARLLAALALGAALLLLAAAGARAEDSVPTTAGTIAAELDSQLAERLGMLEGPAKGTSLILTTPVSLEDMEQSCPLARLLGEEMAVWFVQNGYRVREVRKAKSLMLEPGTGELALSRDLRFVDSRYVKSAVLLTATYTQTTKHVRFNVRLLHAPTGEVLAMAARTLGITKETRQLLDDEARAKARRILPNVRTVLGKVDVAQSEAAAQAANTPWGGFRPMNAPGYSGNPPQVLDLTE